MEMDACTNKRTGRRVCIWDISDSFPVTFLMGELSLREFEEIARSLTPEVKLLEADGSWEGEPTTITVAMSGAQ